MSSRPAELGQQRWILTQPESLPVLVARRVEVGQVADALEAAWP
jgi:hypothetical protein